MTTLRVQSMFRTMSKLVVALGDMNKEYSKQRQGWYRD